MLLLFRSWANAAVPVAEAVAERGTPESVSTEPETVPAGPLRLVLASTRAVAEPVDAAAVFPELNSATKHPVGFESDRIDEELLRHQRCEIFGQNQGEPFGSS